MKRFFIALILLVGLAANLQATLILKTNTATTITVGPFVDVTDAKTPEVALTATNEHLTLVVTSSGAPSLVLDANATASAGDNDMVHITNDDAGYYSLELTAAQLNYLGNARLSINYVTDHLPVFCDIQIVSAQQFDFMFGTTAAPANVTAINSIATSGVTTIGAYQGTTQPVNFTGTGATAYVKTDLIDILGTGVSTPATAGILDVNVKNMNNVPATSVTTIAAHQGTTQPINFHGSAGTAYVKTDLTEIADATVSATTAQLGVNVVNAAGTAWGSGAITAASIAADADAEIADAIWDEDLSGHATVATAGQRLQPIRTGTAQAGAASTITLDAAASAGNDFYKNALVQITAGTGASQVRTVSSYVGSTKVATITPNWVTTPSSDSVFTIVPTGAIAGASAPDAPTVAAAVWDLTRSGHSSAGTFGEGVASVQGNVSGTVSAVTTVNGLASNVITAASLATDAGAEIADAVADEVTAPHSTADSIGYILHNTASSADIATAILVTPANKIATNASGYALADVTLWKTATAPAMTGDAYARLGAPAGASTSADIAAAKVDTAAIKVKTDYLPSVTAGAAGGLFIAGSNAATSITTALTANITGNVTGNLSGSVGSVTGAVGSVTGNVGGNVTGNVGGSVASVTGRVTANVDQIDGASWGTHATGMTPSDLRDVSGVGVSTSSAQIGVNAVNIGGAAAASATIGTVTTATNVTTVNGLASGVITATSIAADAIGASELATDAVAEMADGIWDEALSGHATGGTAGAALSAAGAGTNPWDVAVSGHTTSGSFGEVVNNTSGYVDTEVSAIKTKTDYLPSATAGSTGGLFIAGSNAATTVNITGNLSGSVGSVTGRVAANVDQVDSASLATHSSGYFPSDIRYIGGSALNTSLAQIGANSVQVGGTTQTGRDIGASVLVGDKTGFSLATPQTFNLTGNITGNLSGSVGSVTGAVGSVTGAVGSVTGAVGSVGTGGITSTSFGSGAINAAAIATDAIGAAELATDAVAEVVAGLRASLNYQRGVQADYSFPLKDTSGNLATGKTVTATISKDHGSFVSGTNSVTEIGNGFYKITLTAGEMTAASVRLLFTASGCQSTTVEIRPGQ
jgi:hypothetical protein